MNVATDVPPPLPSRRGPGCLGWSLILGAACVALCAGGGFILYRSVSNAFTTDGTRVREITAQIADFNPPGDLRPIFGVDMNFGAMKIQAGFFAAGQSLPMALLVQFAGTTAEDAQRQLDDFGGQAKDFVPRSTIEKQVTVHGQQVTATIQTGAWRSQHAGEERQPTVKASAGFEGRGGTANVMVLVPGDDDAAVGAAVALIETVR